MRGRRLPAAFAAAASLLWTASVLATVPGEDRLPDLAMARPVEMRVDLTSNGARYLRFAAMIVNIGRGPFETRASRASRRATTMSVKQRIYDAAGAYRVVATGAHASYSGDGHDHWHVQHVAAYELFTLTGALVARSPKVGFCFFDTRPYRRSLPGTPRLQRYTRSGCGTERSMSVRNGISVGWADVYGAELRFQAINVTGVPPGDYLLKVTADPAGAFLEANPANNCNWSRIRLRRSSAVVTAIDWGAGCILPGAQVPTATPSPSPAASPSPSPNPSATPTVSPTSQAVATPLQPTRSQVSGGPS